VPVLKDSEITEALRSLVGWNQANNAIERSYEFKDFAGSLAFVNRVADAAEAANHHPDIDIRYNKVKLVLTSHDSGGVTQRDIKMAGTINKLG
jgi:4a-hydroxytetrahydrobiopterin dehydratase